MKQKQSDVHLVHALDRLERFATLTDARFRIPFAGIRFGLDSIIGVIPVLGDLVGFVLSLYLFAEAQKLGVPTAVKVKMVRNVVIDFVIGLVPIVGDIGDIGFRSNLRNVRLIVEYIESEQAKRKKPDDAKSAFLFWTSVVLLSAILIGVSAYLLQYPY